MSKDGFRTDIQYEDYKIRGEHKMSEDRAPYIITNPKYEKELKTNFDFSKLRPLGDTIIAMPVEKHEEIGGIIIPQKQQEQKTKSVVVAVGPGRLNDDGTRRVVRVKVGDVIFHSEYAGSETKIEGKKYLIMHGEKEEVDVFGIFTGDRPIDIQPFDDRVLIEWEEAPETFLNAGRKTNILTAGTAKTRHYTGIVIALGPEVKDLRVGDRVFFNQFCSPTRIDYDN